VDIFPGMRLQNCRKALNLPEGKIEAAAAGETGDESERGAAHPFITIGF
jgi:hypothetical protein